MRIAEALALAVKHHQAGNLAQAEPLYRHILAAEPNHPETLHLLGMLVSQRGQPALAVDLIQRAIRCHPQNGVFHYNLGNAWRDQGQRAEAIACYQRTVQLLPDFPEAHNNLGAALKEQGQFAEASTSFRRVVQLRPDQAQAHNNLGAALKEQGQLTEAVVCFRRAVQLRPDYAQGHNNLGVALKEQGQQAEAIACYQQALRLKPDYPEAHNNLGIVFLEQGQQTEAIACYQQALRLKPDYPEAHNNLGLVYLEQGHLDEALNCFQQAIHLNPNFARAHWNRALHWLLLGDFERGWPEYEWGFRCAARSANSYWQPLWDGSALGGRVILLHAEQGLGDTLQFIRYASRVKQCGGTVLCECPPELFPLLESATGVDQVVAQGQPLPPFDVHVALLSLPGIFRTTLATIPTDIPYLQADPQRVHSWGKALEPLDGFRVGLVWQGNPGFTGDRQRSIPLRYFAGLAAVKGVQFVSLQKGPGASQLRAVSGGFPILDLGPRLETFSDTAAVLENLDLVISSCTAVPHLAGALGVPVWLALPFAADWRWLVEREDSPWYTRHRLFRQSRPGAWEEVFERIATELTRLIETRRGR